MLENLYLYSRTVGWLGFDENLFLGSESGIEKTVPLLCVCYLWSCGKELILTAALAAVLYSLRPLMPISRKTAYSDAMNE